jgi:predicted GIY-YIG superfamily endonuclease
MWLHQIKEHLHSKGSKYESEEKPTEQEIFASYSSDKKLISRKYWFPNIKHQKNNLINKWTNELNRQFSKEVQITSKLHENP